MGISPLHASTVGLILNPNINRLSPQFHCVYDDHFETIHSKFDAKPPDIWEKLSSAHSLGMTLSMMLRTLGKLQF